MKIMRGIAVALTAAILASGGGVATSLATAQPAQAASTQSDIDAAITQILNETNTERANVGLAPLKLNSAMTTVAQNWTQQMATQQSMIHNPNYQTQLPQPWIRVGENVGQGYTKDTIVAAWMASPGHKANILGDFTHIGLGYWIDDAGRGWFTQDFGKYDVPVLTAINTPTTTVGKFNLTSTWDRNWNENVDNYKADLYAADGTLLQSQIIPVANGTVTFSGLTDLTNYSVNIVSQATNALGEQFVSPVTTVTATTLEDVPTVTAPTNLALTPGENSMGASWTAPTSYNGTLQPYTVELSKSGVVINTVQTSDPRYTFTGLTSNTGYTVKVTAIASVRVKTATASISSNSKTLLSSVATVTEPTNVTATSDSFSSVKATWGAPASQTGVNLKYVVTLSAADKQDVVVTTTNPSYTFAGLNQNSDYSVTVQASIASENGANNATTTGVTVPVHTLTDYSAVQVTAPAVGLMAVNPTDAIANWDAPSTVVGNLVNYTVTVKQAGQPDRAFTTTNTFYDVTGLVENTAYSFTVTANASSLNGLKFASATSVPLNVTTPYSPSTAIVSAPTSVAVAMPSLSEADVTWQAPATVVGTLTRYKVALKNGDTVVESWDLSPTTFAKNFTNLTPNTLYTVEVTATGISPDGSTTTTSPVVSFPVNTASVQVTAPTGLQLSNISYNAFKASWTAPTGTVGKITQYNVTVKQNGTVKSTYSTTGTSYAVTGLNSNSAYTVEVTASAVSNDGLSQMVSPVVTNPVTTLKSPVVSVTAPVTTVSAIGLDRFTVAWTQPSTVGFLYGYKVVVRQGTTIVKSIPVSMLTTSLIVTGLNEKTAYTVTVEATALAENNVNSATAASTAKSLTTTFSSPIAVKASSLNGSLGAPTSSEISGLKNGGVYQTYQGGTIYYSPASGAHVVRGGIRSLWASKGSENGGLGYPTSDENGGLKNGGVYQTYQGGAIYYSPASGAHVSTGGIRSLWASKGYENGSLGYPTSEEIGGLKNGGVYQMYQGGAIYWSPASGAHISTGGIRSVWASKGYENGSLGYPTSEEIGGLKNGGVYQMYQGGAIYWSPASGAHTSTGGIRSLWASTGYQNGRLGYPTSEEYSTRNGGVSQNYQRGTINWTPTRSSITYR